MKANQSLLLQNESSTQLILYNAIQKELVPLCKTCIFGTVTEHNQVVLLFSNVPPNNLYLFSPTKDKQVITRAIHILISYLIRYAIPIKGVSANRLLCTQFITYYSHRKPTSIFKEYLQSDILELRELKECNVSAGIFRLATKSDCETITSWNVRFAKDVLGLHLEYDRIIETVIEQIDNNLYFMFENPQHICVSMACVTRRLLNGVAISYVYTAKPYRLQGYSTTIMYLLSKYILEDKYSYCTLLVDKSNPIANSVYENLGYKVIDENLDYRLC